MHDDDQAGRRRKHCSRNGVANVAMVYRSDGTPDRPSSDSSNDRQSSCATAQKYSASSQRLPRDDGVSAFQKRGLSQQATCILLASWKPGTSKQYKTFHARWFQHCGKEKIDPFCASIESVIEFLTNLFHLGLGYSALNPAGSYPLVIRFMKGVYKLRPSKPRYTHT